MRALRYERYIGPRDQETLSAHHARHQPFPSILRESVLVLEMILSTTKSPVTACDTREMIITSSTSETMALVVSD